MQWESTLNILKVRESKASLVLPFQFLYPESGCYLYKQCHITWLLRTVRIP